MWENASEPCRSECADGCRPVCAHTRTSPGGSASPGVEGVVLWLRARWLRVHVPTWGAERAPPLKVRASASVRTCIGGVRRPGVSLAGCVPPTPRLGADWLGAVTGRPPPGAAVAAAAAGAGARVYAVSRRVRRCVRPAAGCAGEPGSAPTRGRPRPSPRVSGAPALPAMAPARGRLHPALWVVTAVAAAATSVSAARGEGERWLRGGGWGWLRDRGRGARCPRLNFLSLDLERRRGWILGRGGTGIAPRGYPWSRDRGMEKGTRLGDEGERHPVQGDRAEG